MITQCDLVAPHFSERLAMACSSQNAEHVALAICVSVKVNNETILKPFAFDCDQNTTFNALLEKLEGESKCDRERYKSSIQLNDVTRVRVHCARSLDGEQKIEVL